MFKKDSGALCGIKLFSMESTSTLFFFPETFKYNDRYFVKLPLTNEGTSHAVSVAVH